MVRDCSELVAFVAAEIRSRTDLAVLGLSGGADSTLTALLCREALGPDNVTGVSMPCTDCDQATFNAASARLAKHIGIHHLVRPVTHIADAIDDQAALDGDPASLSAVNRGNSRSRARMCVLYGIAHALAARNEGRRIRVIGTGNLSEDFIGYDTKGGDALADLFPIGELFKSEVYQVLEHFRDTGVIPDDLINRVPSAGLEPGQTDEGDLGVTYDHMEQGIRFCLAHYDTMAEREAGLDPVTAFVWKRHGLQKHKHEAPPVVPLRALCR